MSLHCLLLITTIPFNDNVFIKTKEILKHNHIKISVASPMTNEVIGANGTLAEIDITINEVKISQFDAVILIEGKGKATENNAALVVSLIKEFSLRKKIIAAIGDDVALLADAGVLFGRKVTGLPTDELLFRNRGAEYTGMPTETDGNIITGRDPDAAHEFANAISWKITDKL